MATSIQQRTYEILSGTREHDRASQIFQWFIITLVTLNVIVVILATVEELRREYERFYQLFEIFSVVVFTIEYVLRVWSCTVSDKYRHSVKGRLRFMATPAAIIDLLAILPFFIPRITNVDLRAIRALRLFRLLRLLKLGRFSSSIDIFSEVISQKKEQMFVAAIGVSILLVFASSAVYFAEKQVQPEAFSSIPDAMWWGVATLTTVGYGDVVPVTTIGKVLGGLVSFLGIGFFALPAGILASGFEEAVERQYGAKKDEEETSSRASEKGGSERANYCSCCGQPLPGNEGE